MKLVIVGNNEILKEIITYSPPQGINIKLIQNNESSNMLDIQSHEIITVIIEWSIPLVQGILASWIYDKLKDIKGSININGKKINNVQEEKKIIEDEIQKIEEI